MKKKVLLMGRSGSGKTSMRALVFSSYRAAETRRLGSTLDVEHSHVRFLGNLVLNLWDCGGQQSYMDSYLDSQRNQVFTSVGVLIYVFDLVGGDQDEEDWEKDVRYYRDCLSALRSNSPDSHVFCLLHKMDLVDSSRRRSVYANRVEELTRKSEGWGKKINCFATSIWDESLYKAWSRIIHTLIPNVSTLERHLDSFSKICSAEEVVLFEKTTFLVIAKSGSTCSASLEKPREKDKDKAGDRAGDRETNLDVNELMQGFPEDSTKLDANGEKTLHPERFEKVSELVKKFKLSCSKLQSQFQGVEIRGATYTAYLDVLTANTYIMVIVSDPRIQLAAIKLNVELSREHFEKLQAINISR